MLDLAATAVQGAHPYFVPVEHTAMARERMGPEPILAVEQMVVLDTDRTRALETARAGMAVYLRAPNYVNNLKRHGFTDDDVADGGSERLVDAIVVTGDAAAIRERVDAQLAAGASHVCVQVLKPSPTDVPEAEWVELADALEVGSG
jgi:probable F420-dependent oxidoreductase